MPRQKQKSRVLEKAVLRTYGLKAIDPNIDFGNNRNLENMTQIIEKLRSKIQSYNTAVCVVNAYKSEIKELEKTLGDLSAHMLLGVAVKYGKDSYEYEMAGGVRKSERIRRSTISRLKASAKEAANGNTQSV
ncbi:hypothetical protein [Nostoc sp. 106C]|jgi:predicted house-cleaning NTP pyrophosphatase (Maf/HAM1 superfamily)|uniref:hypothetical protein n=1 Tax=Nostoc sp. 106C TaxID=1932667 RepID=UPI000A38D59F|nr:hypothetical protein [Nostoc sp. 106C]OUL25249.1 hypothetical protein BV378_16995 [Nostoc sp. RF31YmG]OUL30365.1 hypothetical protein BV375_14410 [Nostoc sp. 106C]